MARYSRFISVFKKVMLLLGSAALVVLFIFTLTAAVKQEQTLVCSSVQVKIDYESGLSFLTTSEIAERVNELVGGSPAGKALPSLDLRAIENGLLRDPFVASAKVYIDHARVLHASVFQKQPVLRIINNFGVGYYISDKGDRMPLCSKFTAHVPVALGYVETAIDKQRDSAVQAGLLALVQYLRQDSLMGAIIDHMYVLPDGDVELYPRFAFHKVEFGNMAEDVNEKFGKLKVFYHEGLSKVGWDKYKVVDLRFRGQVVCRKVTQTAADTENEN